MSKTVSTARLLRFLIPAFGPSAFPTSSGAENNLGDRENGGGNERVAKCRPSCKSRLPHGVGP